MDLSTLHYIVNNMQSLCSQLLHIFNKQKHSHPTNGQGKCCVADLHIEISNRSVTLLAEVLSIKLLQTLMVLLTTSFTSSYYCSSSNSDQSMQSQNPFVKYIAICGNKVLSNLNNIHTSNKKRTHFSHYIKK